MAYIDDDEYWEESDYQYGLESALDEEDEYDCCDEPDSSWRLWHYDELLAIRWPVSTLSVTTSHK